MKDFVKQVNTIELLAKHEEALADLYSAYSEIFPECEIWPYLYEEERKHAGWITSILDNVYDGSINFDDMHFSARAIEMSIRSLQKHKKNAENGDIDLETALEKAFFQENSIIENKFLNYFTSTDSKIQKVIDELISDTIGHKDLLEKQKEKFQAEKRNKN